MKIFHCFHGNISYILFEVEDQSEAVQVAVLEAQLTNLFQINNANDAVLECIGRLEVKIFLCFHENISLFLSKYFIVFRLCLQLLSLSQTPACRVRQSGDLSLARIRPDTALSLVEITVQLYHVIKTHQKAKNDPGGFLSCVFMA